MSDEFSRQYVLARWVYSELLSPTLADRYQEKGVPISLKDRRRQGETFDALNEDERNLLAGTWPKMRGVDALNQPLTGITMFKRVEWKRKDLGAVHVLPLFVHDVVSESLFVPLNFEVWIWAVPVRPLHQSHARYAGFGLAPSSMQDDPLTVGRYPDDGRLVLLDGYHRASA